MITICLAPSDKEIEEFEFVINGQRRMSLSVNPKNLFIQIPGGVKEESMANSESSFFLRSKDFQ